MLPYPSGKLHMGHVRNYTINDVMSRYMRMQGFNVLMPMGWDAFGLPAENAAIEQRIAPAQWTRHNIADMKAQMQPLGLAFDWSREIATCDPSYYSWNQWLFLKMLERGIAYRKTQTVNWDPVDNTVLANEQVIDGRGWRSGALVEKREIPGYYLRITRLRRGAARRRRATSSTAGPSACALMQANWIGKSEGVNFGFPYDARRRDAAAARLHDARRHHHGRHLLRHRAGASARRALRARAIPALAAFIEECKRGGVSEADACDWPEKQGMPTGLLRHPSAHPRARSRCGSATTSLMGYGEGAVMGVPAHDERDFAFAKQLRTADQTGDRGGGPEHSRATPGRSGTPTSARRRISSTPASTTA